jgi:hypothetical protein
VGPAWAWRGADGAGSNTSSNTNNDER